MKIALFISLLMIIVFLAGCITPGEEEKAPSKVGLSATLTSDLKKVTASTPVTFILTVKNLASEKAEDISVQLVNLTGWQIEDSLKFLDSLASNDLYKFSWLAYSPSASTKTFVANANLFYKMKTNSNLKLRVYNNNYLAKLKQDERERISSKSAVLSSTTSKLTPISISISLAQPFILTSYYQRFPFVIEIKNLGIGSPFKDTSRYPPLEGEKDYVKFSFTSNATLQCDFDSGELVKLVNRSKSIACRLIATQDEITSFSDFEINFSVEYYYLDKALAKITVA